jgi:hypothetical protein
LRREALYSAALIVLTTLASAAPITVPPTPKNEATTADVAAASAPPASCSGLSVGLGRSAEVSAGLGRAADMGSVWSAGRLAPRGYDDLAAQRRAVVGPMPL